MTIFLAIIVGILVFGVIYNWIKQYKAEGYYESERHEDMKYVFSFLLFMSILFISLVIYTSKRSDRLRIIQINQIQNTINNQRNSKNIYENAYITKEIIDNNNWIIQTKYNNTFWNLKLFTDQSINNVQLIK